MSESGIITKLEDVSLTESGVSFLGEKLKLDKSEDCDKVVDAIKKCNKMDYLNLEGNTLGVEAAEVIGKALESKPELKRALWKDMFTGRMKEEIPKALLSLGNGLMLAGARLTELDMSDNAFGPIGVEGLASLLSSPTCYQLKELKLNNNGLGISGGKMLSKALLQCHEKSIKEGKPLALKVFIAGRNRLENKGAEAMSEVFKALGTLEEIVLPQNGIYKQGIKALSKSFAKNPNLRIINLNDNTLTKATSSLAQVLPSLQNLKVLNLGDCLLKTSGAEILAAALSKKHNELEELIMSSNEINSSGGLAVVEAMKNKKKLKRLSLNGNTFGEQGCENVKSKMEEFDMSSCLDTLSEDEGEEEDEDQENGEEDEDDEDEKDEEEENESELSLNNSELSSKASPNAKSTQNRREEDNFLANALKTMSIENENGDSISLFLKSPTVENFKAIDKYVADSYIKKPQNFSQEFYLETLIPLIIKISALSHCSDENVKTRSSDLSFALYKSLFSWAAEKNQISTVTNSLVIYLGLIKSEDKSFKVTWDTKGSLSAFKNAISSGIVPQSTADIINFCALQGKE